MPGQAMPASDRNDACVVMGVAGCGKTLVGSALAQTLGWTYVEGDLLHPPANVQRMASGLPLTDEHRWGWLDAIGQEIAHSQQHGAGAVAACSALKRAYRDRLRRYSRRLLFVYLEIDRETAAERVAARKGHFMPASLVDSQFAALEPPGRGEMAVTLDARRPVAELVGEAAAALGSRGQMTLGH
jgi:gluconokinase